MSCMFWHAICNIISERETFPKMKLKDIILFIVLLPSVSFAVTDTLRLTLDEAIEIAQSRSSDAKVARHTFLAAEWSYKFHKANYLPTLTFTSGPSLNRVISKITQPDGTNLFVEQNQLSTNATLSLTQNVPFTGGQLFLKSSLLRQDEFANGSVAYNSQPVVVGYQQTLFGYNSLKWDKRIEPVRYDAAKKSYDESMELIASRTVSCFFNVAQAQSVYEIAMYNSASADTLSRYARGRYNIGTITENEMLQLELNRITAETNVLDARNLLDDAVQSLRSYLALDNDIIIEVEADTKTPACKADAEKAIRLAYEHNPTPMEYKIAALSSHSNLAQAKAASGLKADLYIQFGLSQTARNLHDSYRSPLDQQYVSIGVTLPILDWGRGKGRVRIAESNVNLVETQVEQAYKDFENNIIKMVRQFNLQAHRVESAEKTASLAQRRYEVARHLYLQGKSTILDLNTATQEKDYARRSHINAIATFWELYYGLRSLTGGKIFTE